MILDCAVLEDCTAYASLFRCFQSSSSLLNQIYLLAALLCLDLWVGIDGL